MMAATSDAARLERAGRFIDRIAEHVSRSRAAAVPFGYAIVSVQLYRLLVEYRRQFGTLNNDLLRREIETCEDRERAKDTARILIGMVRKLDDAKDEYADTMNVFLPGIKVLGPTNIRLLEDIACSIEDVAETLALAASPEFMAMLEKDLSSINEMA